MINSNKYRLNKIYGVIVILLMIMITACSKDNNPVEVTGGTSKVAGRVSTTNSFPKTLGKDNGTNSDQTVIQGAVVTLAQVQANGSLKTVSTQSVQTDVSGKFVVETNLSGVKNLVVVAAKGTTEWKAIVSSEIQNGATVVAPPLSAESTTEAEFYIKLVSEGNANDASDYDLQLLLNSKLAAQINGNSNASAQYLSALHAQFQATSQAAANSYFGITASQLQIIAKAKAEAHANLDVKLYESDDSDDMEENHFDNYQDVMLSAYSTANVNADIYAKLVRIGLSAFVNASSSMSEQMKLEISKCLYQRYSYVLAKAELVQFQAAGATASQINAVASAGITLRSSIKNAVSTNQIADAFAQFHSSITSQLKLTLTSYASAIDSIDIAVNASGGAKSVLNLVLSSSISFDLVINAYVTFFNSIKTLAQTTLTGATSAQVNAAAQILILANMN